MDEGKPLCVALFDYEGQDERDLPFKQHQVMEVLHKECESWWQARLISNKKEGYIPTNFVKLVSPDKTATPLAGFGLCSVETERKQPWFHGRISRETAEMLLYRHGNRDGAFLIRESTHFPGDFTLSVCFNNEHHHYRVQRKGQKLSIDGETFFDNLSDVIDHYHQQRDGLCSRLRAFCPKKTTKVRVDYEVFAKDGWEIEPQRMEYGNLLGSGEFGDVVLGKLDSQTVAIKTLKATPGEARDDLKLQEFLAEAFIMTHLRHPYLLRLYGVVTKSEPMCIVLEFMARGTVLEFLRSRGRGVATLLPTMALQIGDAMAFMESNGFVHRDLAARNVLVGEDNGIRVADFGLTRRLAVGMTGTNAPDETRIPIRWTAPEVLHENIFLSKSDVWSFGVTLWELFSFGRVPYSRMQNKEVVVKLREGYRLESPPGCPPEFYELMKTCWAYKHQDRPSFADLYSKMLTFSPA